MKISKEGRAIIPVAAIILGALATGIIMLFKLAGWCNIWIILFWSISAIITWGFVIAFFRVPKRPLLVDDEVIFAPCDGTVVVAEDVHEMEILGDKRIQISIFMSVTNVHINWFPVGGKVTYFKHHNGKFMVAWHPKSSDDNERTTTAVESIHGPIVFRQVAGLVARRIISYAKVGEQAIQNSPCGFIKFGSRVDIYLPLDAEILIKLGDKVRGSQSPIARFKQK